MGSVDTNILLRWTLGDLPEQSERAAKLLESSNAVQVADAAITEMAYVLERLYKLDRSLVAGHIRLVMGLGQVNCNRQLFSRVLPLYEQNPQLSMIDCCLAVYAELNDAEPLYTFDKQLARKLPVAADLMEA